MSHETGATYSTASPAARTDANWNMILGALWLLWAALLLGGFVLGGWKIPGWCKLGSSVVLVVAGFVWFLATRGELAQKFALAIAIGMTLGFLGDVSNSRNVIIGGIIAFGIGHVFYIWACAYAARVTGLRSSAARWISLALWWAFAVVAWYFVVYRGDRNPELIWPALPYTLLLAGTAGMATSLAVQNPRFLLLAVGAALFLISDLVLAFNIFSTQIKPGSEAVWLLYGPGQMGIVYALAQCRSALRGPATV